MSLYVYLHMRSLNKYVCMHWHIRGREREWTYRQNTYIQVGVCICTVMKLSKPVSMYIRCAYIYKHINIRVNVCILLNVCNYEKNIHLWKQNWILLLFSWMPLRLKWDVITTIFLFLSFLHLYMFIACCQYSAQ